MRWEDDPKLIKAPLSVSIQRRGLQRLMRRLSVVVGKGAEEREW
jgi:hypothetical protein